MPDLTLSQMLGIAVVGGVVVIAIILATGGVALEGDHKGIDRRKQPFEYWLFVSIFAILTIGAAIALINANSN